MKSALEAGLSLGRAASGVKGPLRPWRQRHLKRIFASGDTLRLQFPQEDLGFSYDVPGGACLGNAAAAAAPRAGSAQPSAEAAAAPARSASQTKLPGQLLERQQADRGLRRLYMPSTDPGARLPHADINVIWGHELDASRFNQISTLDLLPYTSTAMLLLVGGGPRSRAWAEAAVQLHEKGSPLRIAHICSGQQQTQELCDSYSTRPGNVIVAMSEANHWTWLQDTVGHIKIMHSASFLKSPEGNI